MDVWFSLNPLTPDFPAPDGAANVCGVTACQLGASCRGLYIVKFSDLGLMSTENRLAIA